MAAARRLLPFSRPLAVPLRTPFAAHNLTPPPPETTVAAAEVLALFRTMSLMRHAELAVASLYSSRLVRGFCHLAAGQEAVAAGLEAGAAAGDALVVAHRDHCAFLGRGGAPAELFAELMGRRAGSSRGKAGSMHLFKKELNLYGGHGICGAPVPIGCGIAFAQKYLKLGSVSFAVYGDGAANQGQVFEGLNAAAIWGLPVVLVCENNHYGMGTAASRSAKCPEYYKRGDYVPGLKVDGMDVLAVKHACEFARDYALKNGPIILEMDTYRYHGHSLSDPQSTYRTHDEVKAVKQERDPIQYIKNLILSEEVATAEELKGIEMEIRKELDKAIAQAKDSHWPDPVELFTNVYSKGLGVEGFGPDRKTMKVTLP